MLDKKIEKLLNEQINKELFSAYLYLGISDFYIDTGLDGLGNWYYVQAQEERDHAMLFREFIQNCGGKVILAEIKKPDNDFKDLREGIAASLEHERYITGEINRIYEEAMKLKDYKTLEFLNWFIKEQVEEEKNAEEQLKKFDLFGSEGKSLYMLDKELLTRIYSPPSLVLS